VAQLQAAAADDAGSRQEKAAEEELTRLRGQVAQLQAAADEARQAGSHQEKAAEEELARPCSNT
jgi:type II secretory pathway component PulM